MKCLQLDECNKFNKCNKKHCRAFTNSKSIGKDIFYKKKPLSYVYLFVCSPKVFDQVKQN